MEMGQAKARQQAREDKFDPQKNGTIKAVVSEQEFTLRRPRIGENRAFLERLQEMAEEQDANKALPEDERDPDLSTRLFLGWWRDVFTTLKRDGDGEFPEDDDDCPLWLVSSSLVQETRSIWSSVPWGPGGSPQQRQAREAGPMLAQAAGLLGAVGGLANAQPEPTEPE